MSASNDGAESVDQFLARIASLSEKKDGQDAERSRRTEEEMLQARKERQARRAGIFTIVWFLLSDSLTLYRARSVDVSCEDRSGCHTTFTAPYPSITVD